MLVYVLVLGQDDGLAERAAGRGDAAKTSTSSRRRSSSRTTNPKLREGLRDQLQVKPDLVVVGDAGTGDEAIARSRTYASSLMKLTRLCSATLGYWTRLPSNGSALSATSRSEMQFRVRVPAAPIVETGMLCRRARW